MVLEDIRLHTLFTNNQHMILLMASVRDTRKCARDSPAASAWVVKQ